jgi:hypothetical protein
MPDVMKSSHLSLLAVSSWLLFACGGSTPAAPPPAVPSTPTTPATASTPAPAGTGATATPAASAKAEGHKLLVATVSCWFGGVWSEAEGADSLDARKAASEARCHDATRRIWGKDDNEKYEQLRAIDANAVDDATKKVVDVAGGDSVDAAHKDALGKLLGAVAAAKKEEMLARRAGDRVKRDLAKEPEKLNKDEVDAIGPLKQSSALEALLKLDAGDLTAEAQALGLMTAMEHMSIAKGLPRHLKIYAVTGSFKQLYNVDPPAGVTEDLTRPLTPGTWLACVSAGAKGAGHPVPDALKTPVEKEPAAWAGVIEGLKDKIAPIGDKISADTPLKDVVGRVAKQLEREYTEERNAIRRAGAQGKPAPALTPAPK